MIRWHIIDVEYWRIADPIHMLAEEIKFAISGHAVSADYNPKSFFSGRSMITSPQMDIDPSKPREQEEERVDQSMQVAGQGDYQLILEVDAMVPNDEYDFIKSEIGVTDPEEQQAPFQSNDTEELMGAIRGPMEEFDPESGVGQDEWEQSKQQTEALREYLRNNPPMNGENQDVITMDRDGNPLSRKQWLTQVVGPWIAEDIPGLPYGVVRVASAPLRARQDLAPGTVLPFQSKPAIWVVGKGVFELPSRHPKTGALITFGKDPRGAGRQRYKKQYDPELGKIVSTTELTSRARQSAEGSVADYITGNFKNSTRYQRQLIGAIKDFFQIPGGQLESLVYGPNNEHVSIWEYPRAAQAERDEQFTHIWIGVTITLGDQALQDPGTLLGHLRHLWTQQDRKLLRLRESMRVQMAGISDVWIFRTGLAGLPRIYGAISKSGNKVRQHFGTTAETFWNELEETVFGITPGDTGVFRGSKGAFKEVRVRDNGDILFLFEEPKQRADTANGNEAESEHEPEDAPENRGIAQDPTIQGLVKGAEEQLSHRFQPDPDNPEKSLVPLRDKSPPVPMTAQDRDEINKARTPYCPTCSGSGQQRVPLDNPEPDPEYPSIMLTYKMAECPTCKGSGVDPAHALPAAEKKESAPALKAKARQAIDIIKSDKRYLHIYNAIMSHQLSDKQKYELIIGLGRYARAKSAGEEVPNDPFERFFTGETEETAGENA